jgi:hypothetical protein
MCLCRQRVSFLFSVPHGREASLGDCALWRSVRVRSTAIVWLRRVCSTSISTSLRSGVAILVVLTDIQRQGPT